jgi:hypothetical protein
MWGAATGVDWKPRPSDGDGGYGDKMTYDASKYRGIAFWAKSSAPLDGVQVAFPDLYTDGAAPPHDMPNPTGTGEPLCTDCRCIYNAASEYNCSPFLVQFGEEGRRGRRPAVLGLRELPDHIRPGSGSRCCSSTRCRTPGNGGYHTSATACRSTS